jgi:MYXO-CTERM domain-containing protein
MQRRATLRLALACVVVSSTADAHFNLKTPESWTVQDGLGDPQKLGPCGSDGTVTPSGIVTAYNPGDTVTITFNETIFHPGHYRVALAVNDRSELPAEPVVTPGTGTPCGTAAVMSPIAFPVLADGVLDHTQAFTGMQTIQVKLPDNIKCSKCTLQIIEFMSQHPLNMPGGCFYHHCADISIGVAPPAMDGGTGSTTQSGCACSSPGASPAMSGFVGLFAVAAFLRLVLLRRTS